MRKTATFLFCLIMLLMCATPLLLQIFGINSPNLEKRTLSAQPVLISTSGDLNGNYTSDLDNYIADHFPLRTCLISAWHQLNINLLGQSGNSRVILGKEKWLFFAETAPSYLGQDNFTDAEYDRLDTILRLQAVYLESRGIRFLFTVAPNKNTIYPDLMPDRYVDKTDSNTLADFAEKIGTRGYVNLRDLLEKSAADSSQALYHRTDSHWNNRGALLACIEMLDQAGGLIGTELKTPYQAASYEEKADWQGDLAVMLFPSGPVLDIQQHYAVEQGYRYVRPLNSLEDILISTQGNGTFSLLMFRDSFANALIPMLSESFKTVTYSRAVPYNYALLDKAPADLVILEIAERNLRIWLESPPRMPAIAVPGEKPVDTGLLASYIMPDLVLKAEKDQTYLKITGQISGHLVSPDWTRVLVSVGPALYEAFPVTPENQGDSTAGFVLYLDAGQWQTGTSEIEIFLKTGAGWVLAFGTLDLP